MLKNVQLNVRIVNEVLCGVGLQTAQRKIREIIHQVKQQQQKNQQGAATPSQHTK